MDDIRPAQLAKQLRLHREFSEALNELFLSKVNSKPLKSRNDEPTTTTKSTDKEDSKISSKSRNTHFPPGEAEWL